MRFLFLQGPNSFFFARLASRLADRGHDVLRVNFCGGDRYFGVGTPARDYTATLDDLGEFYEELLTGPSFDAVLMFAEHRPVHLPMLETARRHGVRTVIFEEGYFRPNWITMEEQGTNAASSLPRNPGFYRSYARSVPTYGDGFPVPTDWNRRVAEGITYHFWNGAWRGRYPNYQLHRPYPANVEVSGWARRLFVRKPLRRERYARTLARVWALPAPYFFFPLQLDTDSQIRRHSDFSGMPEVIRLVLESFAGHVARETHLVIKNHPLDNGMIDYDTLIGEEVRRLGIDERVHFIESASVPELLRRCVGVVTVNSTVGSSGLLHGKPVKAIGRAIYDMPGLTWGGALDAFWRARTTPDERLFHDFRNAVIHLTQINGNFYSRRGQEMAIGPIVASLEARDMGAGPNDPVRSAAQ